MKTFVTLACLVLFAAVAYGSLIPDPYLEKYSPVFSKCLKIDITPEGDVEKVRAAIDAMKSDHEVGCLLACALKEVNVLGDSGLNVEVAKTTVEDTHFGNPKLIEKLQKVSEECIEKAKDTQDQCDMSIEFVKCYVEKYQAEN